jgi:protein gp37
MPTNHRAAEVQAAPMTEAEARGAVEAIRSHLDTARRMIYDLHRRAGWRVLGYHTWEACMAGEFDQSRSAVKAQLQAAYIENQLACTLAKSIPIGSIPARQLIALEPVRDQPDRLRAAWDKANEATAGKPTATAIQAAVDEVIAAMDDADDDNDVPTPEPDAAPFQLIETPKPKSSDRPTFNATNEMVDWARWTWNPVTGCEHNCVYCYARDLANRFYPEKFKPTFHPDRIEAPGYTRRPAKADAEDNPVNRTAWRNVFVCSMADLFGRWVPDEWINAVLRSCHDSPQWNYLFLTKFPNRYDGIEFPETAWVGTSVDEQKRVANAEKSFAKVKAQVKWLSVEPMREKLSFSRLDLFDWVVIGGQSRSSGAPEFHPPFDWCADLYHDAKAAGCAVYFKPNTKGSPDPWLPKEYPKAMLQVAR